MRKPSMKPRATLWIMALAVILIASACGSAANATPTVSIVAIFTAAYQTFSAQEATQLALTPPTETPLPTLPPTLALHAMVTVTET